MTRIHGATSYPTPPALDSAAGVAPSSRPARALRSQDGSPLSTPGAPNLLAAKPSTDAGTRARIASARLFAGPAAPDDVPGGDVPDAQLDAGVALFVTISQLCRPGHDRPDPLFTYRLRGEPSNFAEDAPDDRLTD